MLKKRSTDPIRTVSVRDPAIDHERSRVPEFIRMRDLSLLVFDGSPTYFDAKRLSQAARLTCDSSPPEMRWRWAFLSGVTCVSHPDWAPRYQVIAGGAKVIADDEDKEKGIKSSLDFLDDEIVDEIGAWIYQESRLHDPRSGRFSLPPGSAAPIGPSRWAAPKTAVTPIQTPPGADVRISDATPPPTSTGGLQTTPTLSTSTSSGATPPLDTPTASVPENSSS